MQKGQKLTIEAQEASKLSAEHQHEFFGFQNLHYSVSEASGVVKIRVNNKQRLNVKTTETAKVGVRTQEVPDGAKVVKDFEQVD